MIIGLGADQNDVGIFIDQPPSIVSLIVKYQNRKKNMFLTVERVKNHAVQNIKK